LIADIRMPGMSGLELASASERERCKIPIIFYYGAWRRKNERMQALRAGAVEFIGKTVR